jgi:predicted dehydrogenase
MIVEGLGVRVLDIARFLPGDVASLSARKGRVNSGIRGEDFATMLLSHDSDATSVVDVSYATRRQPDTFPETLVEIDGETGSSRCVDTWHHCGGGHQ